MNSDRIFKNAVENCLLITRCGCAESLSTQINCFPNETLTYTVVLETPAKTIKYKTEIRQHGHKIIIFIIWLYSNNILENSVKTLKL